MIDLTDQRFGRLTALKPTEKRQRGSVVWRCLCDCGNKCLVSAGLLKDENTKSCGCLNKELTIKRNTKHGYRYHPLYAVWRSMIARCENKHSKAFKHYGHRNIQVCDEWRNDAKAFIEWALTNGWKKGLTIERQNNDGPYSPKNCHFITQFEQADNTRNLRWFFAYNKDTGEWDEDNNQMEFSRRHSITNSSISACLLGKQKTHKKWRFQWITF